jgi:hypothetical protein
MRETGDSSWGLFLCQETDAQIVLTSRELFLPERATNQNETKWGAKSGKL